MNDKLKQNIKDLFFTIGVLSLILVSVMGWHWSESAKTKFWWVFWDVAALSSIIACVGLWLYWMSKDRRS